MNKEKNILLAFYGDDLTGSTDALEFICRAGAKTILFMKPPTPDQLKTFTGLQAFGVAGRTRSLPSEMIEEQLLPAFNLMKETGAKHIHYKVCSTFDSSPHTGSIGKAIDCGALVFQKNPIPVLGGTPVLGRYCLFGNLFARMGIGSSGKIYRLDRHPSMRSHPVTPAYESDLRIVLGSQTKKKIGLINIVEMGKSIEEWNHVVQKDEEVILLDILVEEQLIKVGEWLETLCKKETLFSVGSSGIEMALGTYWNHKGILNPVTSWLQPERAIPLLVISGSCSPVTTVQIEFAKAKGFEEIILDAKGIHDENPIEQHIIQSAIELLQEGKHVIIHTGKKETKTISSVIVGKALGTIAREAITRTDIKRVVVSGGDTSSYAAAEMEIDALEMIAPMVRGAPLCRVYSKNKSMNGIEINFKGGQVGGEDYFVVLAEGS